ncbi:MAG: CgeB family protein [Desulfovibrio sp.]
MYPYGVEYLQQELNTQPPRILLVTAKYFVMGELTAAFDRQNVPYRLLDFNTREMDLDDFVQTITEALNSFQPHCVLTVNHLGVDHEGVLLSLLDKFHIPLVSWFVDNPHLILSAYSDLPTDNTILFTWDNDTLVDLKSSGYSDVFHLPLGADPTRFSPTAVKTAPKDWYSPVSFVGNSMVKKTTIRMNVAAPPQPLAEKAAEIALNFGESHIRNVFDFIHQAYPELVPHLSAFDNNARKAAFETFITWYSTLLYRTQCVQETLSFQPLIVGDDGWKQLLPPEGWTYHSELNYYEDLPTFYQCSTINFNCTSKQMKGAVNQRVFDVPTAGGFLLTDERAQIDTLFELDKEIIIYRSKEEIPSLIDTFLHDDALRQKIIRAARTRVLNEHTYDHRIGSMLNALASLGIHGSKIITDQ